MRLFSPAAAAGGAVFFLTRTGGGTQTASSINDDETGFTQSALIADGKEGGRGEKKDLDATGDKKNPNCGDD